MHTLMHMQHMRTHMHHTCVHTRTSTHTHTHVHIEARTCTHSHTHAHVMRTCTCAHVHTHAQTCTYTQAHTYTRARTHAQAHAHTHTRTHHCCLRCIPSSTLQGGVFPGVFLESRLQPPPPGWMPARPPRTVLITSLLPRLFSPLD